MRSLSQDWTAGASKTSSSRVYNMLDNWALDFIDRLCSFTSGQSSDYRYDLDDFENGEPGLSIESDFADMEELSLKFSPDDKSATITKLLVNSRGQGIGRFVAISAISDLSAQGFHKFDLDAQDMGPGFWPKLGFMPLWANGAARARAQESYAARLSIIEPYISKIHAAMLRIEIRKFDETTPYALSKIGFASAVSVLVENKDFLKDCALDGARAPEELSPDHQLLFHALCDMDVDYPLKLGSLMNLGMRTDMELDLKNPRQFQIFAQARARLAKVTTDFDCQP